MILAVLQARMSSSRLQGKVLKKIIGEPMLWLGIERIKRAKTIEQLVVATSFEESDDEIEVMCKNKKIACFRGSLNDVLDRFYQVAKLYNADHVVRLTGDNPLADPDLIDRVVNLHLKENLDYTVSDACASYPDGLDVEVFSFLALKAAWEEAKLPSEREHVGPYVEKNPERFKAGRVYNEEGWLAEGLRWTVDEQCDFELVRHIYEDLYIKNKNFTTKDILDFLDKNSELKKLNCHIEANEGFQKSLAEDEVFKVLKNGK